MPITRKKPMETGTIEPIFVSAKHAMANGAKNPQEQQEKQAKSYVDTKAEAEVNKQAVKITAKPVLDMMEPASGKSNGTR